MNADFIIDSIAQNVAQDCDVLDYEKDGLLYCGHCDTPKQCRIDIAGTVRIVKCQCACAARKYEAEKKRGKIRNCACALKRFARTAYAIRALLVAGLTALP